MPFERPKNLAFRASAGVATTILAAGEPGPDGKPKLRRFEGVAYTGGPMYPEGWKIPVVIDQAGWEIPDQQRPALRQHDHEQIVGHTDRAGVEAAGLAIAGVFSGEKQHTDKVTVPADNGFRWELSVGADPDPDAMVWLENEDQSAEVNGQTVRGPAAVSRKTRLGEISFVPLGADSNTSATVFSAKKGNLMFAKTALKLARTQGVKAAMKYSDDEIDKMSDGDAKAALKRCMADDKPDANAADDGDGKKDVDADDEPDANAADDDKPTTAKAGKKPGIKAGKKGGGMSIRDQIRAEAATERKRVTRIQAMAREYGVTEVTVGGQKVDFIAHAIEAGLSADKAELLALRAARPGPGVGMVPGGLAYSAANPEITAEVLEVAVLQANAQHMRLDDDSFYRDEQTGARKIPEAKQKQIQAEFKRSYSDKAQQHAHTLFRGQMGLQQLLVTAARQNGYRGSDRVTDGNMVEVVRAGMGHTTMDRAYPGIRANDGQSTASIAHVTANVQNKFALVGYFFVEQAWRFIAPVRNMNDFKPSSSINIFGDTVVKRVGDNGQIEDATLADQAFSNQVDQNARLITIGRKSIINDDTGILTTVPMLMGRGAARGFNNYFWVVFLNLPNVNGDDGNPFWRSAAPTAVPALQKPSGPNLLTGGGSALSSAGLQAAKQMYDNQVDPNGNPLGFDDEKPVLLHPPELWVTANELVDPSAIGLVYGGGSASKQPNVNLWKGRATPVMSRYLNKTLTDTLIGTSTPITVAGSTTAWYFLMPAVAGAGVVEAAFLGGVDTPTVQMASQDWNFDRLGLTSRVVFDYGANQQQFRAGVKAAGS